MHQNDICRFGAVLLIVLRVHQNDRLVLSPLSFTHDQFLARGSRLRNATAADPRLMAGEMQAIAIAPAEGRKREFVLSLRRIDYLVADCAAMPVTVTRPNIGRETGGQPPGPNALADERENLRECHTSLPCRLCPHPHTGSGLKVGSGDGTMQIQYSQRTTPLMFGDVHTNR